VDNREAFDRVQGIAQIRYFTRIRQAAVEVRGIDDKCISFPMTNRVSHEEPDVFAKVFASVQIDDTARVIVIVQDHNLPRSLKDRVRIVSVFSLKRSGQSAARVEFDMPQVFWWIHV